MAKYKTTMRDIAKDCNVSVATVSYVLNHSQKEKISHETRLKVLESATKLKYSPRKPKNHAGEDPSHLVGIIINLKEINNSSKELHFYELASELSKQLYNLGFGSILIPTKNLSDSNLINKHNPDALFIIDADHESVEKFTKEFYIPILFLDCEIYNPVFCRIYPNYTDIIDVAKKILDEEFPFLIMEDINNIPLKHEITKWFRPPDVFINYPGANLMHFLSEHRRHKGIVIGDILGMQTERLFPRDDLVIVSSIGNINNLHHKVNTLYVRNEEKATIAINIFQKMLHLDYKAVGDNRILLEHKHTSPNI